MSSAAAAGPSVRKLAVSVDLEEWYHSRRWVDQVQARTLPDNRSLFRTLYGSDEPAGEIIAPTQKLLDLFDRHACRCTFFVLGEVAGYYPDLVREIAGRGHEIACHGMHHVDMTILGPKVFEEQLEETASLLTSLVGQRPVGYRAPNLVYAPWATKILERHGFLYDSTVCVSRPLGGKYRGWAKAPRHPYHPSYDDVAVAGAAKLIELPLPAFPGIRLAAGSGITTRIFGYNWTYLAVRDAIRSADTAFYFHPWELARRPRPSGHRLRNAVFMRHTGDWMFDAVERILTAFSGRVVTSREAARRFGESDRA